MSNKIKNVWEKRILAIVILFAMVCFWRGTWGLLDIYFFPDNYELSLWISIGMGIILLVITRSLIKEVIVE